MVRRGFGLITAIIIMLTVAVLMSLMIGLSTASVKQTSDIFIKEQTKLYVRSAIEYAMMAISGHNNNTDCIEDITLNFNNGGTINYTAKVDLWYMGKNIPAACHKILANHIQTDASDYTVVMDVVVEANKANLGLSEPIRVHRRTLQKP